MLNLWSGCYADRFCYFLTHFLTHVGLPRSSLESQPLSLFRVNDDQVFPLKITTQQLDAEGAFYVPL